MPAAHPAAISGSEPNISFKVNGVDIGNSGSIAYQATPTWVKVGGSFVATTSTVDLEVVNATAVASGNDFGIDDISINVCESRVAITGQSSVCEGSFNTVDYTVSDGTQAHSWYQFQLSTDGGTVFNNLGTPAQAMFAGNSYTVTYSLGTASSSMNGYKYRMLVATSQAGLSAVDCIYFNDYTLRVTACGPLPVTLVGFNGKYNNGLTSLDWQTTQEINNDRFDILRSSNGKDFTIIGKVSGAGNSSVSKAYQFQDAISGVGYVYYRLRQVDADSKSVLSSIVRLNMGTKSASFELYPNPSVSNFTASFSALKSATATLQIRTLNGQVVFTKTILVAKGFNAVQLNNLPVMPTGLYHVSVQNAEFNYQGKMQKF